MRTIKAAHFLEMEAGLQGRSTEQLESEYRLRCHEVDNMPANNLPTQRLSFIGVTSSDSDADDVECHVCDAELDMTQAMFR